VSPGRNPGIMRPDRAARSTKGAEVSNYLGIVFDDLKALNIEGGRVQGGITDAWSGAFDCRRYTYFDIFWILAYSLLSLQ